MKKIFKILALILILTSCNSQGKVKNPATQEYIVGTGNIKGNVDVDKYLKIDQRFEIGACLLRASRCQAIKATSSKTTE